ncbi:hypothetical protein SERLA73DRAFT_183209 [Serpula lacrymans var. lacrymans S7.3]|uniref:DUF6534 domain-containing protein n=2 Tax=Serpula lacrymans var. lacrymans TaxID=341189 RepID=F8PZG4_SERL3|nr:uncharacterized protein SERLADRAFT_470241 [Serpula lacrymans var. lacrymans S7.9]EGN98286.1 hypothetical protein SERLA73DRAFT_183209 [Serpula lacrymans var. lacrymans S7.3]EGO23856.1 hypothetical protein SERLADRAFT_470241 [Serpula lacrymans var. lacrymans S7.9]
MSSHDQFTVHKIKVLLWKQMFVVYTVHCLYAQRIWFLSRGKGRMLPILVTIIVVLSTGIAISISVAVYQCYFFLDLLKVEWAIYLTLSIMAFNDIVIAISMCRLLAAHRTGFASTDSTIKMLMMYIVHTGCLTSLFSVLTLLMYAVMPENFIFLGFDFLLAKLYVNSYLALLNAHRYQTSDGASSCLPRGNATNDINPLKDSHTFSFPGKPRHSSWSHEPLYENIAQAHSRAESVSLPPLIPNRGPPVDIDEFDPTTLSLDTIAT